MTRAITYFSRVVANHSALFSMGSEHAGRLPALPYPGTDTENRTPATRVKTSRANRYPISAYPVVLATGPRP
jgi:hypothetical protein